MNEDLILAKELHATYLSIKPSVSHDLSNLSELKLALQYAGHNPTTAELSSLWKENEEKISYERFCVIAGSMPTLTEQVIDDLLSKVFTIDGGKISVEDFKNHFMAPYRRKVISNYDINILLNEVGASEFIDVQILKKTILTTVTSLKALCIKNLEDKSGMERLNSRTFVKRTQISQSEKQLCYMDWNNVKLKGVFFLDKETIISHQYTFENSCMGLVSITMQSVKYPSSTRSIDTLAYLFKESADGTRTYIGYTNQKNDIGQYFWMDTLREGKYIVIPYTSGCHLRAKSSHSSQTPIKLVNKSEEKIGLTNKFQQIIEDIFHQMDLDGNLLLNRQEFNLYNWRTSGEVVQDDEWDVVQNNFDVSDGQLTLKGFLSLHQLEAEDNGGDSDDLWLSLETMGYNNLGIQDQAAPFLLTVYCNSSEPNLIVSGLRSGGLFLDKAVIRSLMEESDCSMVEDNPDVKVYKTRSNHRIAIVIQNKLSNLLKLRVDCSKSVNTITNRDSLDWTVEVDQKSAIIAHHLMPQDDRKSWKVLNNIEILSNSSS